MSPCPVCGRRSAAHDRSHNLTTQPAKRRLPLGWFAVGYLAGLATIAAYIALRLG